MLSLASKLDFESRNLLAMADYLVWLMLDPSKFTIIRKHKVHKILIFHLGAIGELIASTPLLPVLKKEYNAEIHYMIPASRREVIENNPYVSGKALVQNSDGSWTVTLGLEHSGDINVSGGLTVAKASKVIGNVDVKNGSILVEEGSEVSGGISVSGNLTLASGAIVKGAVNVGGNLSVGEGAEVGKEVVVGGILKIANGVTIGGDIYAKSSNAINIGNSKQYKLNEDESSLSYRIPCITDENISKDYYNCNNFTERDYFKDNKGKDRNRNLSLNEQLNSIKNRMNTLFKFLTANTKRK